MNTIYKLNVLDFSPGIRAEYINENFDLVKRWINASNLRLGYGIVEGFELSKNLENFTIHVTEGVIINEYGEELRVEEKTFMAGAPRYVDMVEEKTVGAGGSLILDFCPYSNDEKHTITYDGIEHSYLSNKEFLIYDLDIGRNITSNHIRNISQNVVILNDSLEGHRVRINYFYANDRIDGIFLKKDGSEYIYEMGIISTSPSQEVVQDYLANGYYLIGFAYWHVGAEVDVIFITGDRSLRPIYVDGGNRLFLNGSLYVGNKFIYFACPKEPVENDLWYDVESETLFIWRPDKAGKYEWKPVNDLSRFHREYGAFYENENPDDLMTFTFEARQQLRFVPGKNQLRIVIDQVNIMRDQYEELYDETMTDLNDMTGYGFRLKEPLDRPSVVEVYVDHSLNTSGHTEDLFEKVACFVYDGKIDKEKAALGGGFYLLGAEYEIGNCQLEMFSNGKRLVREDGFREAVAAEDGYKIAASGDYSRLSDAVYLGETEGEISYKITRFMATYDNFRKYTDYWGEQIEESKVSCREVSDRLEMLDGNVGGRLAALDTKIRSCETALAKLQEEAVSGSEKIGAEVLKDNIRAALVASAEYLTVNIDDTIYLDDFKSSDFISIHYIAGNNSKILIKGRDYVMEDTDKGLKITILNGVVLNNAGWAELYLEIIKLGL